MARKNKAQARDDRPYAELRNANVDEYADEVRPAYLAGYRDGWREATVRLRLEAIRMCNEASAASEIEELEER